MMEIGSCMLGGDVCVMVELFMNFIIECMIDCGCMIVLMWL